MIVALVILNGRSSSNDALAVDSYVGEPYDPFVMSYTVDTPDRSYTVDLQWRSIWSWDTVITSSSTDPRHVGRTAVYARDRLVIDDPVLGQEIRAVEAKAPLVPESWLLPRNYAASPGWEQVAVDGQGRAVYRFATGSGSHAVETLYTLDPDTGIGVHAQVIRDGFVVEEASATSIAPLSPDSTAPEVPDVDPPSPHPAQPTEVASD